MNFSLASEVRRSLELLVHPSISVFFILDVSTCDFFVDASSPSPFRPPRQIDGYRHASFSSLFRALANCEAARLLAYTSRARSVVRENLASFKTIVTKLESRKSSELHRYRLIDGARITIGLEKRIKSGAPGGWRSRWPLKVVSEPP